MGAKGGGGGGGGGGNRWSRCLRAPLRVLCRARDLYVRSMAECAGHVQYEGAAFGFPAYGEVPRSFSLRSDGGGSGEEDLRELIRAASTAQGRRAALGGVERSQSVAVGRIDEGSSLLFPRSRSCAGAGAGAGAKKRARAFS
ncbi:uncharacterized protein LOC109715372 [Ananas comosus]|uniref:Uncharacterized protein LOC109715372 n=1 Tax=Ananas comosus TaxID=4615 RepID=A0A6P5FR18_ANACO|nr:uncharacterized protein LOC109715372 [Ananas comosus]